MIPEYQVTYCTKEEINTFIRQLHKFIAKHPVQFRALDKAYGRYENGKIVVDPRRSFIVPTIIHEFLHHKHPKWQEKIIRKAEWHIFNRLSVTQIRNILKKAL